MTSCSDSADAPAVRSRSDLDRELAMYWFLSADTLESTERNVNEVLQGIPWQSGPALLRFQYVERLHALQRVRFVASGGKLCDCGDIPYIDGRCTRCWIIHCARPFSP